MKLMEIIIMNLKMLWLVIHNLRLPGLEPGSPAWKADMLTPTPQTLIFYFLYSLY